MGETQSCLTRDCVGIGSGSGDTVTVTPAIRAHVATWRAAHASTPEAADPHVEAVLQRLWNVLEASKQTDRKAALTSLCGVRVLEPGVHYHLAITGVRDWGELKRHWCVRAPAAAAAAASSAASSSTAAATTSASSASSASESHATPAAATATTSGTGADASSAAATKPTPDAPSQHSTAAHAHPSTGSSTRSSKPSWWSSWRFTCDPMDCSYLLDARLQSVWDRYTARAAQAAAAGPAPNSPSLLERLGFGRAATTTTTTTAATTATTAATDATAPTTTPTDPDISGSASPHPLHGTGDCTVVAPDPCDPHTVTVPVTPTTAAHLTASGSAARAPLPLAADADTLLFFQRFVAFFVSTASEGADSGSGGGGGGDTSDMQHLPRDTQALLAGTTAAADSSAVVSEVRELVRAHCVQRERHYHFEVDALHRLWTPHSFATAAALATPTAAAAAANGGTTAPMAAAREPVRMRWCVRCDHFGEWKYASPPRDHPF